MRGVCPAGVHDFGSGLVEQFVSHAPVGQVEVVLRPFDLNLAAHEPVAGLKVAGNQRNLRPSHANLSVADLHVVVVASGRDFSFQQLAVGQQQQPSLWRKSSVCGNDRR